MDFSNSSLAKLEKMRDTLTEKVQREQERAKNTPMGAGPAADSNRKSMEQRYTEQLDVIEEAIFKAEMADMEQQPTTASELRSSGDAKVTRGATETASSSGMSLHTAPAAAASSVKPQHSGIPAPSQSAPLTASTPTAVCRRKICGYFRTPQGCKKGNACNLAHVDRIRVADTPCGAFESRKKAGGPGDSINTESHKEVVQVRTLAAGVQQQNFVEGANKVEGALLSRPLVPSQPQVGPPDLHPCIRVFGKCKVGDDCLFARYPRDSCLRHLKGQAAKDARWGTENGCGREGSCTERHVVWEGTLGPLHLRKLHQEQKHPCLRGPGNGSWQGCAWKTKPLESIKCPYVNYPRNACIFHLKSQCEGTPSCHKDNCPYPHVDFVVSKAGDGWGDSSPDDGWGDSSPDDGWGDHQHQQQPQGKPPQPEPQAPSPHQHQLQAKPPQPEPQAPPPHQHQLQGKPPQPEPQAPPHHQQTKTFDVAKQVVDFVRVGPSQIARVIGRDGANIRAIEADTGCVVIPPPRGKTGIDACRIDISGPNSTAVKNAREMILRQSRGDLLLHPCLRVHIKCPRAGKFCRYAKYPRNCCLYHLISQQERRPSQKCLNGENCPYPHVDWQGVDYPRPSTVNSTVPQPAGGASALPGWGDEGVVSPEQQRLWQQGYQNGATTSTAGNGEPAVASEQQGQNSFMQGDYWQPQPRPQPQQPFSTHQPHEQQQPQQPREAPSNVVQPPRLSGTPHATALLQPPVLSLDQRPPQHATGATTQQTPSSVPHSNGNHSLLPAPPPPAANAQQQPLGANAQQQPLVANAQQQPLGSLDQQELLPPGVATFRPPPPPPVITPTALKLPPPPSSVGVPLAPAGAVLSTASEWRIVPSGPPPPVATAAGGQPYFKEHHDRSRSRHHQHEHSASSRDDERWTHERRKRSRSRGESRKHRSSHRRRHETENVGKTKYDLL